MNEQLEVEFQREKIASKYLRHFSSEQITGVNHFIAGALRCGYLEYDGRGSIRLSEEGIARMAARQRANAVELDYFLSQATAAGCTAEELESEKQCWQQQHERDEERFVSALVQLGKKARIL